MNTLFRSLIILLIALGASAVDAKVLDWLYDVEVPVASQADAERQRAARGALATVLMRVTGLAALPSNTEVEAALRQPERFYARYEYATRSPATSAVRGEPSLAGQEHPANDALDESGNRQALGDAEPPSSTTAASAPASPAMFLSFHFEPGSVQALLRRAELPIWAANRPTVLAWVAVEQGDDRQLVAATGADDIAAALAERRRQRGLALALPLMDLQDSTIAPTDVWGRFWERINAVSTRYGSDLLLLGNVRQVRDGVWQGRWDLRVRRAPATASLGDALAAQPGSTTSRHTAALAGSFRHQAKSAAEAARLALDSVADQLADRFAVRGAQAAIEVIVYGAQTVRGYASLMKYLRSREFIDRVTVEGVVPESARLRLHSRSSRDQLLDLLSLGGTLTVTDASLSAVGLTWQGAK